MGSPIFTPQPLQAQFASPYVQQHLASAQMWSPFMHQASQSQMLPHLMPQGHVNIVNPSARTLQQFGQLHPCKDFESKRVIFSPYEVRYVGEYCSNLAQTTPYLCSRMLAECLEAIRVDESVHQHFHPRHVESSDRLRPALTAWEKVNGKIK